MGNNVLSKSLGTYLKQISDAYKNKENGDLTGILSSFSQMSKDYSEFTNSKVDEFAYSNYEYSKCSDVEKKDFANQQLQFIECLVLDNIYNMSGTIRNWHEIYSLMTNKLYKNVDKKNRKVIYSCTSTSRPVGEKSYMTWNGFQIIDLDIKNAQLSNELKPLIFEELKKYNWFLGVYKSASGKGLHIWTKISPLSLDQRGKRIEYLCNFRHKYSYVYIVLLKYASKLNYTKDDILQYMDMAMAKPQQGSFISYDDTAMLSTNFKDFRLDVNFESSIANGIETIDWIAHPDLKMIFKKLDWFANESFDKTSNVEVSDIEETAKRDKKRSNGRKHYKHAQRWQLANTLVAIYGERKALELIVEICKDTPYRELAGDIRTASIHNKPISIWAIKELNSHHGFNIKINNTNIYADELQEIEKKMSEDASNLDDPTRVLNDSTVATTIYIKSNQYLSDVKDQILNNLSHITLLEAGAGYGKTEMIKAFKAKTLLILPFTSTIKAKVEASETTKDWLYFYGNKRPTLDNIFDDRSMTMTIDKFSRLNIMELNQAGFDYIVVDESHLLFTSSYRDVMSPAIQRLANSSAKVIMMTGTPTGEMLFFPNIKHIKVVKEDVRIKTCMVHTYPYKLETFYNMCKMMADDIIEGNKVLYPSNKGNLYFETVTGFIQYILNNSIDKKTGKPVSHKLRAFYYKKSNYGDESMENINVNKTYGDNDIIFCSSYLSVGVDICDDMNFSVYFTDLMIPQDIEQYANRLRNNNLFLHIMLPRNEDDGTPIRYDVVKPLDLSFDESDLLFIRDLLRTMNDMLERNSEESKYSPILSSILAAHKALKYDENECKYYIDETTYKLNIFEERYNEYSKQLNVLTKGLRYYGYKVDFDHNERVMTESGRAYIEEFKRTCRNTKHNADTDKTFELLDHINDENIEVYKDFMKGSYEIFRAPEYSEERISNKLFVKDIEIIGKNIPIIVSLYKFYDIPTIKDIYKFCVNDKSNAINYTQLKRIRQFVRIEANRRYKRVDFPVIKFINEAAQFTRNNPSTDQMTIDTFLAEYATRYANSIKDVVVEDIQYQQYLFELVKELWKVIIVETKSRKGTINIKPFELLWEEKDKTKNLFGDEMTEQFFLVDELMSNMKDENGNITNVTKVIDESETEREFEHTSKKRLADVRHEIPEVVHSDFDYDTYSELDGSNERFLRKQKNTNQLVDSVFTMEERDNDLRNRELKEMELFEFNEES